MPSKPASTAKNRVLPSERIQQLGIVLPPAPIPVATYTSNRQLGNCLYLSGQGPVDASGHIQTGKVGAEISVDDAYQHARLTGLNLLAVLNQAAGGLDRVKRVIKLLGLVNATPEFTQHPKVINGCSDLFVEIFGDEAGRGARSAIGAGSLPGNQTVEIEAIFELFDDDESAVCG